MFWKEEKLKYNILIPLNFNKPYAQLNSKEAEEYFHWYLNKIDERIEYLSEYSKINLDFTPESLIILWDWFLKISKVEKTSKDRINELKKQLKNNPLYNSIINDNKKQLSLENEYIIRDIGMYLGKLFIKNHKRIFWTYYTSPKNDFFVNLPLLQGFVDKDNMNFKASFEPIYMVGIQASNLFDNTQDKEDLYNIYQIWGKMTYNEENIMFEIVKKIIDEWDPIGLLYINCPPDEYDFETKQIVNYLTKNITSEELSTKIYNIFVESFGLDTFSETIADCKIIADKIYTKL